LHPAPTAYCRLPTAASVLSVPVRHDLKIDANHVAPTLRSAHAGLKADAAIKESFWVNIIGRGYPPPNRTFRWCTQRMKIDPVNALVKQRVGNSL